MMQQQNTMMTGMTVGMDSSLAKFSPAYWALASQLAKLKPVKSITPMDEVATMKSQNLDQYEMMKARYLTTGEMKQAEMFEGLFMSALNGVSRLAWLIGLIRKPAQPALNN